MIPPALMASTASHARTILKRKLKDMEEKLTQATALNLASLSLVCLHLFMQRSMNISVLLLVHPHLQLRRCSMMLMIVARLQ